MRHLRTRVLRLCLCASLLAAVAAASDEPAESSSDEPPDALVVEGRVLDPAGEPIRGAHVRLHAMPSIFRQAIQRLEGLEREILDETRTDGAGIYRLQPPEPGLYEVLVEAPGFPSRSLDLAPLPGDRSLPDLRMPEPRGLPLRVVDGAGEPVEGALVLPFASLFVRGSFVWKVPGEVLRTDEAGRAEPILGEGERPPTLSIVAPGYAPVDVEHGAHGPQRVELGPGVERMVQVKGPDGEPVEGAVVLLGQVRLPVGRTDAEGRLAIRVPEGAGTPLRVATADGLYLKRDAVPAAGGDLLALRLDAPRPVAGRVVDGESGEAVAGALVWPFAHPDELVRSDDDGAFEVVPLPGVEVVRAGASGYQTDTDRADEDGGELRLELDPSSRLEGRVVDDEGRGLPGIDVSVTPQRRGFGRSRGRGTGGSARTDAEGRFALAHLMPGTTYTVRADPPGWGPARETVRLLPGSDGATVELVLHPGIRAVGQVVDEADAPVAGAAIRLYENVARELIPTRPREPEPVLGSATSDAAGEFTVTDLAAGTYRLEVDAPRFAPARVPGVEVQPPTEDGEQVADLGIVVLVPGAEIRGVVTDADETPLEGVAVHVRQTSEIGLVDRGQVTDAPSAVTGADGRFAVGELVEGQPHELIASLEGRVDAYVPGVVPSAAGDDVEIVLQPTSTLRGRVVDETGAPLEDAHVMASQVERRGISSSRGAGGRTRSGPDGSFEIGGLAPGPVTVEAQIEGRSPARSAGLHIEAGEDLEDVELRLGTGNALEVQVLDVDGAPVEGFVFARKMDGPSSPGWSERTDASGRATLRGLPEGQIQIHAQGRDGGSGSVNTQIRADAPNRVKVRFRELGRVEGQVVGPDGIGVEGARVWVAVGFLGRAVAEIASGPGGAFVLEGVPAGLQRVLAEDPDLGRATTEVEVGTEPVTGLLLELAAGTRLHGDLLGLSFDEISGARVFAGGPAGARPAEVLHDGSYRIEGLTPGAWNLMAMVGDRQVSEVAQIEEGMTELRVDLDFGQGSETLEGRVMVEGKPLPGAPVTLRGAENQASASTDYQGRFVLRGLEPGTATVEVMHLGNRREQEVEIPRATPVELEFRLADVSGRVVDPEGRPIEGARIETKPVDDDRPVWTAYFTETPSTDARGRFAARGLDDGEWRLSVAKEGYSQEDRLVTIDGGLDLEGVEIVLQPTRGLWIDLRAPLPLSRVSVVRLAADGTVLAETDTSVDSAGAIHLPSVPPGTWRLQVLAPGLATASLVARAPEERPTVRFERASQVVVKLEEGTRLRRLRLLHPDGTAHHYLYQGRIVSSPITFLGLPRFDGVPAGSFVVEAELTSGETLTRPLDVRTGETHEVELP